MPICIHVTIFRKSANKDVCAFVGDCHKNGEIDGEHGELIKDFLKDLSDSSFKTLMIKESDNDDSFIMPTQCFNTRA